MSPRIYLLRHGEALHNVPPEDHSYSDPVLTHKGHLQALGVASTYSVFFSSLDPATTLICSSPLRRTMQTTLASFSSVLPPVASSPVPLVILPQIQECGAEPCDRAASLEETKAMFPQAFLDWTTCDPAIDSRAQGWDTKEGFYAPVEERQVERARWFRMWMRDECRAEKLVVVCHHGFLRRITKTPHDLVSWRGDCAL